MYLTDYQYFMFKKTAIFSRKPLIAENLYSPLFKRLLKTDFIEAFRGAILNRAESPISGAGKSRIYFFVLLC